jgi:hypothetical protein
MRYDFLMTVCSFLVAVVGLAQVGNASAVTAVTVPHDQRQ